MDRSELNEKAKKYISNAGFGTGTNITLHGLKCMMVDFYLDNQEQSLPIDGVIDCKHENEEMHQGDGFVYVTCKDCGEDL